SFSCWKLSSLTRLGPAPPTGPPALGQRTITRIPAPVSRIAAPITNPPARRARKSALRPGEAVLLLSPGGAGGGIREKSSSSGGDATATAKTRWHFLQRVCFPFASSGTV